MRAFSSHQNHERKSVPCSTYFLTPSCQDLTPDPYFPKVYQLYSSGDEVCQPNMDRVIPELNALVTNERLWVAQEAHKGDIIQLAAQLAGRNFSKITGGWSQNKKWSELPSKREERVASPMFIPFPKMNGKDDVHALQEGSNTLINYDKPDKPAYLYRAALLARDIPALTWPAGSMVVDKFDKTEDLMNLKTPENDAPWPRTSLTRDYKNQRKRWYHGDYRAQAYLYTYRLYDLIVRDGRLKQ